MQDDLQKAYSAYQQALYLLPNPKVNPLPTIALAYFSYTSGRRIQSSGMVLASCTIDMVPSTMLRKPFRLFFAWTKVNRLLPIFRRALLTCVIKILIRLTRFSSDSASFINSKGNMRSPSLVLTASFAILPARSLMLIFGSKSDTSMSNKKTLVILFLLYLGGSKYCSSTLVPRMLTSVLSLITPTMRKSYSNSVGCTTKMGLVSRTRSSLSNT